MTGKLLRRKILPALAACALLPALFAAQTPRAHASGTRAASAASVQKRGAARTPKRGKALWPGSRFTEAERARAVRRGLRFIYRTAHDEENFRQYGSDYLWCFYTLGAGVSDAGARRVARSYGVELARRWRNTHRALPEDATASEISDHAFGSDSADSLGLSDPRLKEQIRLAAARHSARDFLMFDPLSEPPPSNVPFECEFDRAANPRGSKACGRCGRALRMRTRADVWYEALIISYVGDSYGVTLGARYADVLRWLPSLRPYDAAAPGSEEFYDTVYALTHVVYTLNDYGRDRLPRELLPEEFAFLKNNLREAIRLDDPDMLGEFMDSLRAFGMTEADAEIRAGVEYLLARQNADGSWGDTEARDIYQRYHPTWNAVAAISDYAWRAPEPAPRKLRALREALSHGTPTENTEHD